MSILNVNTIQPIGSGTTVTVAATELKTSNFITVGTGASVTSPSANVLTLGTNSAERLRITSAGLIGIGTVSPSGPIHAHAASGTQRSYLEASASHSFLRLKSGSTSYNSGLEFFSGASNIANITGLGAGGLQFEVNGSERLRIDSSGYLGLNNAAPHNQYYNNLVIGDGSAAGDKGITIRTQSSNEGVIAFSDADSGAARYAGKIAYNHGTNAMMFFTLNGDERLRITSGGLAINKSAAADAEIEIVQSADPTLRLHDNRNAAYKADFLMAGSAPLIRNNNTSASDRTLSIQKGTTDHLVIEGSGSVRKPLQPLAVIGTTQNNPTPSAGSIVQFDYVATNRGNHYNTSNYTFTCPVAGDYMVIFRHSRKGWCGDLDFQKNGTTHAFLELRETGLNGASTPVPDWQAGSYSFIVPCAANDVLRWRVANVNTSTGSGGYLLDGHSHIKYDAVTYYLIG